MGSVRGRPRCGEQRRLGGFLAATLLAVPLSVATDPAAAARVSDDRALHSKRKPAKPETGPILAVISLAKQRIWIYGSGGLIAQSVVSTGVPGHRTPTGVFSVIQKSRFHRSNIYSNAPMPYMQRITWSGVALHAGIVPGYPASHGCIRLPNQFAAELWGMTRIGARVVITPDEASVFDVEHSRLPVPLLAPVPWEQEDPREKATNEADPSERPDGDVVGIALKEATKETSPPAPRLLNPLERAKAIKARAIADAAAKAKAGKVAVATSALKAAEASKAIAALREAHLALAAARSKHDAATRAVDKATAPEAVERAKDLLAAAESKVADAEKAADEARAVEAAKTPEAIAAAKAAWEAEKASTEAAAALKAAERDTQPISIFVSKKTARVYVRQAWTPVHEAPVEFKDPGIPIGTHAYVAVSPEANGKALRWLSASLPPSAPTSASARQQPGRAQQRPVAEPAEPSNYPRETAATVLARFELPEDTRRFIEERLWTGASLIVSDEGISNETGTYTDFIVLTR